MQMRQHLLELGEAYRFGHVRVETGSRGAALVLSISAYADQVSTRETDLMPERAACGWYWNSWDIP